MIFSDYFPIWDKLSASQQNRLRAYILSEESREITNI